MFKSMSWMIISLFLALFLSPVFDGLVLCVCWAWFVSPALNVPTIPIIPAIGITLVSKMLLFKPPYSEYSKAPLAVENVPGDFLQEVMELRRNAAHNITEQLWWTCIKPLVIFIFACILHSANGKLSIWLY